MKERSELHEDDRYDEKTCEKLRSFSARVISYGDNGDIKAADFGLRLFCRAAICKFHFIIYHYGFFAGKRREI